jgi:hypothetical protein
MLRGLLMPIEQERINSPIGVEKRAKRIEFHRAPDGGQRLVSLARDEQYMGAPKMSLRRSRIQLKGPIQSAKGIGPLKIAKGRHETESCVRVGKGLVYLHRSGCQGTDLRPLLQDASTLASCWKRARGGRDQTL